MKAVFITNSGPGIGGGHLSRCFALSSALTRFGAKCSWILNGSAAPQAKTLGVSNAIYLDDPFDGETLARLGGFEFAVVDSYAPAPDFYASVARKIPLVAVDDLHDRGLERFARILINYNIGAERSFYNDGGCEYLIGPHYAMLREEYWELEPEEGDYTLFAPGAADIAGSAAALASLWGADWGKLVITLGPLAPDSGIAAARHAASAKRGVGILVSPRDFPKIMAGARRVICSASVTANEALAMEKATAVFSVADNQRGLRKILRNLSIAYDLGDWSKAAPDSIKAALRFEPNMKELRGLVNRRGAIACAEEIMMVLGGMELGRFLRNVARVPEPGRGAEG
jgi:spore coat polysaccharide biosynthesis predicted glycosyltransferase SpsG